MKLNIFEHKAESGKAAAELGAQSIREAVAAHGHVNIIVATGASQFEILSALTEMPEIPWHKLNIFHLDEYVGISIEHPASFRRYLWERFHKKLPTPPAQFHYLNAEENPQAECERVGALIRERRIHVCFAGIGENGHLAFNDPPADFETEAPYQVVELDEACRKQQMGEGWFPTFSDVPTHAISMSIRQIMKSEKLILTVPDERKAQAVKEAVEGPVTPVCPASIVQQHADCQLFLDQPAAGKLRS
ncbi:glucosamine-6-phosphate deaminase [Kiritimatiellaeota bacterium B1221]|nr:glucosamine-6-phosphate deaminase [Kiritimatiellaeota bacterium B1221]